MPKRIVGKNKYEFKLSICMMVKDEEQNLPRCLESIRPLLNKNYVELIIIDTGSTDKSIEISKQYTNKVYFHQWNNNFSEMRNISISYAKGQWIWILDADEELIDIEKLIILLESKLLDDFNTVQFLTKNILFKKSNRIIVQPSNRLFRNDGEFKFAGAVHNQPYFKKPILSTDIYFYHYGYINDDPELMAKKFKRTVTLLKKELEKDPENIYYHFQLSRSYGMHKNFEEGLGEARIAYDLVQKNKNKKSYQYVYLHYAYFSFLLKKYDEAIGVCKVGLNLFPEQMDLFYILGFSQYHCGREEESITSLKEYVRLFEKGNGLDVFKDSSMEVLYFDDDSLNSAIIAIAEILNNQKSYEELIFYLNSGEQNKKNVNLMSTALMHLKRYIELKDYYQQLKNEQLQEVCANSIEKERRMLNQVDKNILATEMSVLNDKYGELNSIRIENDEPIRLQKIKQLLTNYNPNKLPLFYSEIFTCFIEFNKFRTIITELKKFESGTIKRWVKVILDENPHYSNYFIEYILSENIRENDFHSNRVYTSIANVLLLLEVEEKIRNNLDIDSGYLEVFKRYIECGINYTTLLYQFDKLRLFLETLSHPEEKFFIALYFARESIKKKNIRSAIKYYKVAIESYPYMAKYIDLYKDYFLQLPVEDGEQHEYE